jgi:hypothetical protein
VYIWRARDERKHRYTLSLLSAPVNATSVHTECGREAKTRKAKAICTYMQML